MYPSVARLARISSRLAPLALFVATTAGCGAAIYQPSKGAAFELDPATEIDDDDVRPTLPNDQCLLDDLGTGRVATWSQCHKQLL